MEGRAFVIHMIVNPLAGNGYGQRAGLRVDSLMARRGIEHTLEYTEYPRHATELARRAVDCGADTVMLVGGDGTLHETAEALAGTRTSLGVIAAGTGNDFIKAAHIPAKPEEALDFMLTHPPRLTDMARINEGMFLNVAGTGFDVTVLEYAEKAKKYVKGLLPYLYGVIRTIASYKPVSLELTLDGGDVVHMDALICAVGNGQYIGGGIRITPEAGLDDGLLDVTIVKDMPRRKLPFLLPGLLGGKVLSFKATVKHRVRAITMKAADLRVQIDGEITPMEGANIQIMPGALWVHR